ncbi:manganese efflux pump [Bacillaceae bacterium Marseille-Q3522]|nr:manganese efflux pump [Bacillaceae bacterium Marseille-Q3522]
MSSVVTLILIAFALSLDSFSIGLGMGMYKLRLKQICYIGIIIGLFHILMPLLGMLTGRFLSAQFGSIAGFIGGMLLILLGSHMIFSGFSKNKPASRAMSPAGIGLILFALGSSIDSFSVGLTLGIFAMKVLLALIFFGLGAMVLTWIGMLLGKKIQGFLGAYSEALGGGILLGFGFRLLGII